MRLSERITAEDVQTPDRRASVNKHDCDFLRVIGAGHAPSIIRPGKEIDDSAVVAARSRIFIHHLQLAARIGIHDWEKIDLQPVVIDLEFALPTELPCYTDDIGDAVNYADVVETLKRLATARHYELVETMAETMAQAIQRDFGVPWLRLRLSKLAPFPGAEVGIVLERGRTA
jgi:dihydroneopterin aldolase